MGYWHMFIDDASHRAEARVENSIDAAAVGPKPLSSVGRSCISFRLGIPSADSASFARLLPKKGQ